MDPCKLEKCRERLNNQWPLIGTWFRRQAVKSLKEDGSLDAVQTLAGVLWRNGDADLRTFALAALRTLGRQKNEGAQEALCRFVIHHDQPVVEEEIVNYGYVPREESLRAAFFFLTQQWEKYEALDFDHALLRVVYEAGNERLRRRIAAVARDAGRLEWVGIVSGGRQGRRLASMTDAEWRAALNVLHENEQWDEVWRLALEAPPRWSAPMLRRLRTVGWRPPEVEFAEFQELTRLAESWHDDDFRSLMETRVTLRGHTADVRCLAFHPENRLLATAGGDRTVRLWSLPEGRLLNMLEGHKSQVNCLAISPDGRVLASGGRDTLAWLWHLPSAQSAVKLDGHSDRILCLAISPDAKVLATGSADSSIQLWQLPEGRNLTMLEGHSSGILDLAINPDGSVLASAGGDSTVCLWSLPDGKLLKTLRGHRDRELDAVLCLAISPDGRFLATGGTDWIVNLWSLPDGQHLQTLEGHIGQVGCLAFSRDGKTVASGAGDHTIRFWQIPEGKLLESLDAHSGEVTRLVLIADGNILASTSGDGISHDHSVRLWDVAGHKWLRTLDGHTRYVTCLGGSPNGQWMASGSGDGTIRLWTSELARLSRIPVRETTLNDLDWVHRATKKSGKSGPAEAALAFLDSLLRRRHRHDVEIGEVKSRLIGVGEFDIEIEG
jgi:WD40 repeat protein